MALGAVSAHSHEVIHKYLGGISRWVIKPALCALRRGSAPPTPRHAGLFGDPSRLSPTQPYRSPTQPPTQSVGGRRQWAGTLWRTFRCCRTRVVGEVRPNSNRTSSGYRDPHLGKAI